MPSVFQVLPMAESWSPVAALLSLVVVTDLASSTSRRPVLRFFR